MPHKRGAERRQALVRKRRTRGLPRGRADLRKSPEIVVLEHPDDASARFEALRERWDTFHARGRDQGINFDLLIAIEIARVALAAARNGDERGTALNDLGNALSALGERESGTARLEEAVAAYRAALREYTRERVPLNWARSLGSEGVALTLLAERRNRAQPDQCGLRNDARWRPCARRVIS